MPDPEEPVASSSHQGPVLVVAAHPDDEVLGAGGTIARWSAAGRAVAILILGEGSTSRADTRAGGDAATVTKLVDASEVAAGRLGASRPRHGGLPDNRFDGLELLDIVKLVEREIGSVAPTTVLTHHAGDLNVDHRLTAQAVLTATRPQPGCPVRTVLSFEVPSSTEWAFGAVEPRFTPSVFVDISTSLERKVHALEAYEDELRPAPHARSISAIRALAEHRGATVGVAAAEAFELVRSVV